ncbi:MAG: cytochrome c family protein [Betaproteobacteria bacterium]|nr:cytochrome c family protein [Betaproteobacteria bacterium]
MAFGEKGAVSKWWLVPAAFVAVLLVLAVVFINSDMYIGMMSTKTPKYELGEHRGAAVCGTCHSKIYKEWLGHSRHAVATTNESFLRTRDYVEGNLFLGMMMGEESCYACHGIKGGAEGINCEICHGPAAPGLSITQLHETTYRPDLSAMKEKDFCAKCHELFPPLMSPYSQWLESKAAEEGLTCQGCHMAPVDGIAYHGFDSIMHNPGIYEDDLVLRDINLTFPNISMVVENRIKGHGMPSGGPSRVLVLEISVTDDQGKELHKVVDTFYRKFELYPEMLGSMPSAVVIEDTTLKSLEARAMSYALPAKIEGKMRKAAITLRFYDVADQYQGNIEKAHWISGPVVTAELELR